MWIVICTGKCQYAKLVSHFSLKILAKKRNTKLFWHSQRLSLSNFCELKSIRYISFDITFNSFITASNERVYVSDRSIQIKYCNERCFHFTTVSQFAIELQMCSYFISMQFTCTEYQKQNVDLDLCKLAVADRTIDGSYNRINTTTLFFFIS